MSECGAVDEDEAISVCRCGDHLYVELTDDPDRTEMVAALAAMIAIGKTDRTEARAYASLAMELKQRAASLRESQA